MPAALVAVVVAIIGFVLWWPLALLAAPAAGATIWFLWSRADSAVLSALDARPLGAAEGERILNIIERLCLSTGQEQPDVRVVDDEAINLAIVSGQRDTLVATAGFLTVLGPLEMEGAVAHSLMKMKSGLGVYETLVASAPWAIPAPIRSLVRSWDGGADEVVRFDLQSVSLTRYPPGLRNALQRSVDARTAVAGGEDLGTAWLIPPLAESIPIEYRVEVLGEL